MSIECHKLKLSRFNAKFDQIIFDLKIDCIIKYKKLKLPKIECRVVASDF